MNYFILIAKIKIGLSIVYLYNMGSQVTSSNFFMFYVHVIKIILNLTNSADPDEMQHFVALYLGLHRLSNNSSRSQ